MRVHDVSQRFVIRKDKSLKERLVNAARSRQHREDFWALRNVNLEISAGTTVGLIGPNGSGKSTLLKTIGGILQPTTGSVERRGRLAALLELGAGFHPDLTGRENVYLNASILGLSRAQTERFFDPIVEFSGIEKFIDTQVKFYSSGMYVRLAFAVAVHVDPDVLLVDEVLAVGDEPFQRKCLDRIRTFQKEGRTIVLVTHALDQVVDMCDRAVVLESGHVIVDGDPRLATRTLRDDFEATRQAEQQVEQAAQQQVAAKVVAVRILDDNGVIVREMSSGDDLRVQVDVESPDTLDDWVLGIGLDTPSGQSLYGTNTRLLKTRLPSFSGRRTFEIRLRNVGLGAGQYQVHGALAIWHGAEIHRLPQAATFTVEGDGRSVGLVGAQPTLVPTWEQWATSASMS
ncbi:ABC transporter ATP-binding protein [Modestobacter sp. VKM Ac-2985]|uniref:ABC transporter ATP-binding protein n=1 Tax=Modestobacter sp. VKM Ac-2985 TaxID=3004139 RepID=UPI0022ABBC77|nr:ABC transporter ATP-binding protein [Modestobacter sp. VKM Ac-2985]MCZ2838589.1 ABC transporter ATP-binding protein [Modestobacter sp. VKM Ac-2985]